ncbi:MAG: hypothetical protein ACD_73C00806G0002 [uncultured bacterium]|nr:MAG: hypothetical protein ACD_73C00806G0002 [uncultured bacterium]
MYFLAKKILFQLDPETAHQTIKNLARLLPPSFFKWGHLVNDKALSCEWGDIKFNSPIGLAAGFDKNAEMFSWLQNLGFGFIEIGSVTAAPCPGNAKPRIFRLVKDESLINRMGLPGSGADKVEKKLKKVRKKIPVGVNLAKTPVINGQKLFKGDGIEDFIYSFKKMEKWADFIVLNLSCPNTNDGKTFEDPVLFNELAISIKNENKRKCPILVKLSPDLSLSNLKKLIELTMSNQFAGFVVSNTTKDRVNLRTPTSKLEKIGLGGLSGQALGEKSLKILKISRDIAGNEPTIIACGGIMNFNHLIQRFIYGADLCEIYTGFIYNGPAFVSDLNRKLSLFCRKHQLKSFKELKGNTDLLKSLV